MNETEKRQKMVDYINGMGDNEMAELHNRYCEASRHYADFIYSTYELDEILEGRTPTDILCMGFYGDFNPSREFFWLNGYGNLESADSTSAMPIYPTDIADYILRTGDALENDKIHDILDEEEEDNEDNE